MFRRVSMKTFTRRIYEVSGRLTPFLILHYSHKYKRDSLGIDNDMSHVTSEPPSVMHIACWILKTTNTNSEYAILMLFLIILINF